jgi:hypothetical protein
MAHGLKSFRSSGNSAAIAGRAEEAGVAPQLDMEE